MDTPVSVTYRIYKNTIQRFPSSITILNSYACYIIDSDKKNRRYIWIGRLASDDDKQISLNIYGFFLFLIWLLFIQYILLHHSH
jgi:hypothetical protein